MCVRGAVLHAAGSRAEHYLLDCSGSMSVKLDSWWLDAAELVLPIAASAAIGFSCGSAVMKPACTLDDLKAIEAEYHLEQARCSTDACRVSVDKRYREKREKWVACE